MSGVKSYPYTVKKGQRYITTSGLETECDYSGKMGRDGKARK